MPSSTRVAPELLAPAGDRECLAAAIANGADAVYFDLDVTVIEPGQAVWKTDGPVPG